MYYTIYHNVLAFSQNHQFYQLLEVDQLFLLTMFAIL